MLQFNLFGMCTQYAVTNFVIVHYLPAGAQPQVLPSTSAAVGTLYGSDFKLYHCCLFATMARETNVFFGVGEDRAQ